MKKFIPYFVLALPFFLFKSTNIGIWLSDTNIYFYTGYQLLHGKILYKDIFFTNFPLTPYISAAYVVLTQGDLPLFFFTSSLEVLFVGFIIYILVLRKEKSRLLALLTAGLYLYSFIILTTSNHQTGVFTASLFAVLSYFFFLEKKSLLSGILIALAVLTKAYFLPVGLALSLTMLLSQRKHSVYFFIGAVVTVLIILLPSLLYAPHEIYADIVSYSLTRSQGIAKMDIARFFLFHDYLFVLLLFWNIISIKKRLFFGLLSLLSLMFFIFYQDIYYLYLNFCIPFLALSFPSLYKAILKKITVQQMVIPTLLGISLLVNIGIYFATYRTQQKIQDISRITSTILKLHPTSLYGINALTPALAYLTGIPLLNGLIDTNANIFQKGILNKTTLTNDAIREHAMLVTSSAFYPAAGINYPLLGGIFDEKAVAKSCRIIGSFFIQPEGVENAISLYQC